jgi:hypothetical protein
MEVLALYTVCRLWVTSSESDKWRQKKIAIISEQHCSVYILKYLIDFFSFVLGHSGEDSAAGHSRN